MSLDAFIAGREGESGWTVIDPEWDFGALFAQFDTIRVGRATFELMAAAQRASMPGFRTIVISRTLRQEDHPGVEILSGLETLAELKASAGKDIWLFGGGHLFASLAAAGLVDTVEVAVMPVLLGAGVPLAPRLARHVRLTLVKHSAYASGAVSREYEVRRK
jgi:dihydrofolate reductase